MNPAPRVIFESFSKEHYTSSFSFVGYRETIVAHSLSEVLPALEQVDKAVKGGLHAAGFISYEAAPAINAALSTHQPGPLPLVWFALFERRFAIPPTTLTGFSPLECRTEDWNPSLSATEYGKDIERIRQYIASGDTYQVNFTLRNRFRFHGDPFSLYRNMCAVQRSPFCAFIDTGRFQILSVSPELFFDLRHGTITTRPMKGTAPRGRWLGEDEALREALRKSRKERAENLMIVDLLRNDLGKVSVTGSVGVPSLFDVETLETVHQMTSTVSAQCRPDTGIIDIMRALFPCGSVTGAPKKRSMEIIREIEDTPRGVYTGCIGYLSPKGEALFNVAIRTVVLDSETSTGEAATGSGITWDSSAIAEYDECMVKTLFARNLRPEFQLIETLLYEEDKGYFLLERHMARLFRSAAYFGFHLELGTVLDILNLRARPLQGNHRVRLLLSRKGTFSIQTEQIPAAGDAQPVLVSLASDPVDSHDIFLFHKTTNRARYKEELERHSGCTDVLFFNERGEITEGALHNVVVKLGGSLVTPPLEAGLLPGIFREELLASQVIREKTIKVEELQDAEDIFLINSVRKWRKAQLA